MVDTDSAGHSFKGEKEKEKVRLDKKTMPAVGTAGEGEQWRFKRKIQSWDHSTREEADVGVLSPTNQCVIPSPFMHKR